MTRFLSYSRTILVALLFSGCLFTGHMVWAEDEPRVLRPNSFLGSYLAGRYASGRHDTREAAHYMRRALDYDPSNRQLLEQSFLLELMTGNWPVARELSSKLIAIEPSHPFARLFRGVDEFKGGNIDAANKHFASSGEGPLGNLISSISRAWMLSDQGKYDKAIALLKVKSDTDWVRDYQQYHRALIADVNGKVRDAQREYSRLYRKYHQMVRLVGSYAQFLARNGQRTAALKVLSAHFKRGRLKHPDLEYLQRQIKSRVPIAAYVQNSKEGLSEIFFSLGDRRAENGGIDDGLIFLQMARFLRPNFSAADFALGNLLYRAQKYDRAIVFLNNIQSHEPIWLPTQILKAQNLSANGATDSALKLLNVLTDEYGQEIEIYNALGKLYLDEKQYEKASQNYTKAIILLKTPKPSDWFYYYGRGISFERQKIWNKAEKDFKMALKLSPDRPDVLNYLGYSWVDQNLNLKEALSLIRKAVKLKPTSGYFVDSLGWAYYRMGKYKQAVNFLEKAVTLQPDDPVINDHLGDVYWRVGRHNEAKFQWKQVLSLKPEKDLIEQINKKLQTGLTDKQQAKVLMKK